MSPRLWAVLVSSTMFVGCAHGAHRTAPSPLVYATTDEALGCAREALYGIGFIIEGAAVGANDVQLMSTTQSRDFPNWFRAKLDEPSQNVTFFVTVRAVPAKPASGYKLTAGSLGVASDGIGVPGGDGQRGVDAVTSKCMWRY